MKPRRAEGSAVDQDVDRVSIASRRPDSITAMVP